MRHRMNGFFCILAAAAIFTVGCGRGSGTLWNKDSSGMQSPEGKEIQNSENTEEDAVTDSLSPEILELEEGLSAVRFEGSYGFEEYLAQGGASSDADVSAYLMGYLKEHVGDFLFGGNPFGCSTISVQNENGEWLFGRNFDWNACNTLIINFVPESGYASIATVNTDFIQGVSFPELPDRVQAVIALYAPLDGMNEKGLAVSVNMIQDTATIQQDNGKPDLTTTTAVRLLLDQAATVEEAVALLQEYDLHASMDYMVHFALADAEGDHVVVEYVDDEMIVTETPVVTNFYLTEGEKNGIGTAQSHTRYEMLTEQLQEKENMSEDDVRDALSGVSKGNFGEFESTEWSAVFNQSTGEVRYYHRENYEKSYIFKIMKTDHEGGF